VVFHRGRMLVTASRVTERVQILNDDYMLSYGARVVELLNKWFPGPREG
jgi:hypothetical protein